MEKLILEIVTPYGPVFNGQVEEVTARGSEGEFGVLPGHAPLVTTLAIGILSAREGQNTSYFFINSGYAEVGPERVLVLADSAEKAESIDLERAISAKKRAEELLRHKENVDYAKTESALERAVTRINLAERSRS